MNGETNVLDAMDREKRIKAMLHRLQGDMDYEVLKDWRRYGKLMKHGKTDKIRQRAREQRLLIAHFYLPNLRRILPVWRKVEAEKQRRLAAQLLR